jgi:lysophospholipase L1-like esterase
MWIAFLRSFLSPGVLSSQEERRGHQRNKGDRNCRPVLEELEGRALPSATLQMAVMGDSLSAPYESYRAAFGDRSWVQQLQALRSSKVDIHNVAFSGATSDSLFHSQLDTDGVLHGPQVSAVVDLVAQHAVKDVVLMIGANDVLADLPLFNPSNPSSASVFVTTFVGTVVSNVETALLTVAHAGDVHLVVSTVPDVTVTPYFQANLAALTPLVETALTTANGQIEAFAASQEIPVVDLNGLTHLATQTITVGGVQFLPATPLPSGSPNLFTVDGFHPNTVGQGLLANTVLEALHEGYDVNIKHLRLTDQEILSEPGIAHVDGVTGHSYFDVKPYVLFEGDDHERTCENRVDASNHGNQSVAATEVGPSSIGADLWPSAGLPSGRDGSAPWVGVRSRDSTSTDGDV